MHRFAYVVDDMNAAWHAVIRVTVCHGTVTVKRVFWEVVPLARVENLLAGERVQGRRVASLGAGPGVRVFFSLRK